MSSTFFSSTLQLLDQASLQQSRRFKAQLKEDYSVLGEIADQQLAMLKQVGMSESDDELESTIQKAKRSLAALKQ